MGFFPQAFDALNQFSYGSIGVHCDVTLKSKSRNHRSISVHCDAKLYQFRAEAKLYHLRSEFKVKKINQETERDTTFFFETQHIN